MVACHSIHLGARLAAGTGHVAAQAGSAHLWMNGMRVQEDVGWAGEKQEGEGHKEADWAQLVMAGA